MTKEEYLGAIALQITEVFGLNFSVSQYVDLQRRLKLAATEYLEDITLESILRWLKQRPLSNSEFKSLASHLTVGETYFFREKCGLELLEEVVIPKIIKERAGKNEKIRIWCAGCSSGEEPYTISILLKERFPELDHWNVSIMATDINPAAIQKATSGEYTEWSFRDTNPVIKSKYFENTGKCWRIHAEIKKSVVFSYLNLSANSYPSPITNTDNIDVLFCRNVLMYFSPKVISEISDRFYKALSHDGWLIVSQVELNNDYFGNYRRVHYKKGIFYQKKEQHTDNHSFEKAMKSIDILSIPKKNRQKRVEISLKVKESPTALISDSSVERLLEQKEGQLNQLFNEGRYQDCISACLSMVEKNALDPVNFILLIKSYANTGNSEEGVKVIERILECNSFTPEMYFTYASYLQEQGKESNAEVILNRALYLDQSHVLSHFLLGELLLKRNKRQAAIKQFETVVSLLDQCDPNDLIPETEGVSVSSFKNLITSNLNKMYE